MPTVLPQQALRIHDPSPLGDMTLAPAGLTGRTEAQLARAMADMLLESSPPSSGAEALQRLREAFPFTPLAMRVAAFTAMMRR